MAVQQDSTQWLDSRPMLNCRMRAKITEDQCLKQQRFAKQDPRSRPECYGCEYSDLPSVMPKDAGWANPQRAWNRYPRKHKYPLDPKRIRAIEEDLRSVPARLLELEEEGRFIVTTPVVIETFEQAIEYVHDAYLALGAWTHERYFR